MFKKVLTVGLLVSVLVFSVASYTGAFMGSGHNGTGTHMGPGHRTGTHQGPGHNGTNMGTRR